MIPQTVKTWLREYKGNFDFYLSLRDQLNMTGSLSDKQVACVERAIAKEAQPKAVGVPVQEFSLKTGTTLILSKFIAEKVALEARQDKPFRAFEVVAVHRETDKAFQVTLKFSAKRSIHCNICGLKLDNHRSIAAGIGPVCADNWGLPYGEASMEGLEAKLRTIAQVTTWIPKSQIKDIERQVA